MRIMTWNINSVRLRAHLAVEALERFQPDILCLQETKTPDDQFPHEPFHQAGYPYTHNHGMKGYNGVAIISKHPFESRNVHHRAGQKDCRHIAAKIQGVTLHNLYIPAGGDEPDPDANPKFAHKLAFVREMAEWFPQQHHDKENVIALGDFNIAPLENDVWSHRQLLNVVSHTPAEIEALEGMKASLNWIDAVRRFVPEEEKCYTWWSYRNRDWKKSNRGRRLDHIWVTPPLAAGLKDYHIETPARDWEKPSDHVPLCIDLDI